MSPELTKWIVADREMLLTLFQAEGEVNVYSFYEKFNLRPAEILTSIRKLEELGVITFNPQDMVTSLTKFGRFWVVENRREIFMQKVSLAWKAPPLSYVRPRHNVLEPYVPKRRYISSEFFEALAPKI